ncbi:hypothetical protein Vretimale_13513, partial [Volvox reticuliferus]
ARLHPPRPEPPSLPRLPSSGFCVTRAVCPAGAVAGPAASRLHATPSRRAAKRRGKTPNRSLSLSLACLLVIGRWRLSLLWSCAAPSEISSLLSLPSLPPAPPAPRSGLFSPPAPQSPAGGWTAFRLLAGGSLDWLPRCCPGSRLGPVVATGANAAAAASCLLPPCGSVPPISQSLVAEGVRPAAAAAATAAPPLSPPLSLRAKPRKIKPPKVGGLCHSTGLGRMYSSLAIRSVALWAGGLAVPLSAPMLVPAPWTSA